MLGRYTGEPDELPVLESLNEALHIIDADGRIQFCNAALAQLTGDPAETLLGGPSLDLYPPEDRPAVLDRRTRAFQGSRCHPCSRPHSCATTARACPPGSP
jgi:PAS domain S-box-containing protein